MSDGFPVSPRDEANETLVSNARPQDWENPKPASKYNLVVIGAGTAGLVCAAGAAGLGAKVALVEKHLLGGDCLNVGCVPSKALISSARAAHGLRNARKYALSPCESEVDFGAVMERMRKLRSVVSFHDAAKRWSDMGIDVFFGKGRFAGGRAVEVEGVRLPFAKAVIATGARAVVPPVDGIEEAGYLTNETVFSLTERPRRLAVFGAGPLGCELAQSFLRLGSRVTLIEQGGHILSREDGDAAEILQGVLLSEGLDLRLNSQVCSVKRGADGSKVLHLATQGDEATLEVDEILVGAGRAPNVEGIGLEAASVEYDPRSGVRVDDFLRTTNKNIYAAGDVALRFKFTHTADASARIVLRNALFWGRKRLSALTVPWCTYTDPEIAHVGMYPADARKRGIEIDTYKREFADVDRAIVESETDGFVKVHTRKGTGEILGATIVAPHAGEMISEIAVAMAARVGLGALADVIHPYPTQAEAVKHIGDAYNRTRLTPLAAKVFSWLLAWKRR